MTSSEAVTDNDLETFTGQKKEHYYGPQQKWEAHPQGQLGINVKLDWEISRRSAGTPISACRAVSMVPS